MTTSLTFDAVSEAKPGAKWAARWQRSWPAYQVWFVANGGDNGPDRVTCEAALRIHMPELVQVHADLVALAGGSDRAARFMSTWCPPSYLGVCGADIDWVEIGMGYAAGHAPDWRSFVHGWHEVA